MPRPTFQMDALEPRTLLAASPAAHVPEDCPELLEARQDLRAVVVEFRGDRREVHAELAAIRADIREEIKALHDADPEAFEEALAPLRQDLADAIKSQTQQRRELLADLAAVREKWAPILAEDLRAVLAARAAGDEEAFGEAKAKIEADRSALKAELLPIKQGLESLMQETRAAIRDARQAIEEALAGMSPTLASLFDQLSAAAQAGEARLIAGHNAVVAAEQALRQAVADCRAEHADEPAAG